jgi:hypothetical protein
VKRPKLRWIAACLGSQQYEVEVFEPEGKVQSRTVVTAVTDAELIEQAKILMAPTWVKQLALEF